MIRRAARDELEQIVALDQRCFSRPWTASAWAGELDSGVVFVVGQPLQALACIAVVAGVCELRRIAVDPVVRRAGRARDLLAAIIDHAHRHGCERIQLEVAARNEAAVALYRAHGFVVVGRRPAYYRDPIDDALLMDLELPNNGV